MTRDEIREQIDSCVREGHAMRQHRDHEFARGAFTAADKYRRQLAAIDARQAGMARRRAADAAQVAA